MSANEVATFGICSRLGEVQRVCEDSCEALSTKGVKAIGLASDCNLMRC